VSARIIRERITRKTETEDDSVSPFPRPMRAPEMENTSEKKKNLDGDKWTIVPSSGNPRGELTLEGVWEKKKGM